MQNLFFIAFPSLFTADACFRGNRYIVSLKMNFFDEYEIWRGVSIFYSIKVSSSPNQCCCRYHAFEQTFEKFEWTFEEGGHNFTKRFQHVGVPIICATFLWYPFLQNVLTSFYAICFQKWLRILWREIVHQYPPNENWRVQKWLTSGA